MSTTFFGTKGAPFKVTNNKAFYGTYICVRILKWMSLQIQGLEFGFFVNLCY
jgi:hypothetical protein